MKTFKWTVPEPKHPVKASPKPHADSPTSTWTPRAHHLLPLLPAAILPLTLLMHLIPQLAIGIIAIWLHLFFPYLLARTIPEHPRGSSTPLDHSDALSLIHWAVVGVIYLIATRSMPRSRAIITYAVLTVTSIALAYIGLALCGYQCCFSIDF